MTRWVPFGSVPNRGRTAALSLRVTRCRSTEPPTARLTANAARAGPSSAVDNLCTTRSREPALRPPRMVWLMSPERVRRWGRGSTSRRQAGASLAAARGHDGPARPSPHARPEAVRASTTAVIGLERALHGELLNVSDHTLSRTQGSRTDYEGSRPTVKSTCDVGPPAPALAEQTMVAHRGHLARTTRRGVVHRSHPALRALTWAVRVPRLSTSVDEPVGRGGARRRSGAWSQKST